MSGEERKHRGCPAGKQLSCQTGFTESYICIAALVGYRSERQLFRLFNAQLGMTPQRFREQSGSGAPGEGEAAPED